MSAIPVRNPRNPARQWATDAADRPVAGEV